MAAKLIEYLATARLGERGAMTLPKEYRDQLKLETGGVLRSLIAAARVDHPLRTRSVANAK